MKYIKYMKYRVSPLLQFVAFAFYPRVTLLVCATFTAVISVLLVEILSSIPEGSTAYNVCFALTTGSVGSFFVSIVVELSNNYRHNKLGWYELENYYSVISRFEMEKQIHMGKTLSQLAAQQAQKDTGLKDKLTTDIDKEYQKDVVQATWVLLPKIIPVLQETIENRKDFLSDDEIKALKHIMSNYNEILSLVKLVIISMYQYNTVNHPDEQVLYNMYPENILADMPDWMKKYIATLASEKAMDKLADTVMADKFLLTQCMKGYNISLMSMEQIDNEYENIDKKEESLSADEIEKYFEQESERQSKLTEAEFKAEVEEMNKQGAENMKPLVEKLISLNCYLINEEMEILEKILLKKPYYSMYLKVEKEWRQKSSKQLMKDETYRLEYEREKKWLEDNYGK